MSALVFIKWLKGAPDDHAELSVIFYDMTTICAEGLSQQADDIRQFGMSKEGIVARQFMLGLVQTAEGIPLYHEVFDGNTAEVRTLKAPLQKVLDRFPVRRVIVVADRGLLSIDNLAELQAMRLPGGQPLEFILAVPGRRYSEFVELLDPINQAAAKADEAEIVGEHYRRTTGIGAIFIAISPFLTSFFRVNLHPSH